MRAGAVGSRTEILAVRAKGTWQWLDGVVMSVQWSAAVPHLGSDAIAWNRLSEEGRLRGS